MKKFFTFFLFTLISSFAFSQAWDWSRTSNNNVNSIAVDGQQFFISGSDTFSTPSTNGKGILSKRDRNGNLVWQKTFSAQLQSFYRSAGIYGVVTDNNGNIYTSNGTYDSVNGQYVGRKGAINKFDFNGNLVWSRSFKWLSQSGTDAGDICGSAITIDEQDNIYVTGLAGPNFGINFTSIDKKIVFETDTLSIPDAGSFMVLAKIDKDGNKVWIKTFNYTIPADFSHRTIITSVAVKDDQVAIAGTSNITTIYFDTATITGNKGTNFLTLLDAADGHVKWVKNIKFYTFQFACTGGCDAPAARLLFNDNSKIIFSSAYMNALVFAGQTYDVGSKKVYYVSQYDTSGAENIFKLFPNDHLGNGDVTQPMPFYQESSIVKVGNGYYYHVLSHLYKLDSAFNILWTSTNTGSFGPHKAMAIDPTGKIIGQGSSFSGPNAIAGQETIVNPNPATGISYVSRINTEYNIVSGHVFYDINANGIMDAGELPAKNIVVGNPLYNRFLALSDTSGLYECLTDTGTFNFMTLQVPRYHTVIPVSGYNVSMNSFNQHIIDKNFGLTPIPGIIDMYVDIAAVRNNRPGSTGQYALNIINEGTTTQTGTCTLQLSNKIHFLNSIPSASAVYADSVVFNYTNLLPNQREFFSIEYQVENTASFGDSVISYVTVYPVATDTVKENNYDTVRQVVTASFDPNDKHANLENEVSIDKSSEALEYTIRFQNTGNDTAFNIRVKDTLSAKLNPATFELISSTHAVQPVFTKDNIITFYFDNILLADSIHNEPLSHGMVKFRIKNMGGIQVNDSIVNRAGIYFDYNSPVMTNAAKTKYVNILAVNLGSDVAVCGGPLNLNAGNPGSHFIWNTGDTTQSVSIASSGTYWVQVTNSYGSSASDTIHVTINNLPIVSLGNDIVQCGGSTTLDAGNPGSSYLWSSGAVSSTITATTSGTYSVRVTNANGCIAYDTIHVTINSLPIVSLGNDITQCGGNSILDAGNPGSSYLWSNGAVSSTITAATSGTYSVRVTNANGCIAYDSIHVTINDLPIVSLGNDIAQCGGSVILDAGNPGSSYLWNNGAVSSTITAATSGTYSVRVTNANGCIANDTIIVTIKSLPVVTLGNDTSVCAGTAVLLDAGNAGATYSWNSGSTDRTLLVSETGNYSVQVTSSGCSSSDTIHVAKRTLPQLQFILPDTMYLNDAALLLSASPSGGQFTGEGILNGHFDPVIAGAGNHTIQYFYTDITGCSNTINASVFVNDQVNNVNVYPNPNHGNFSISLNKDLRNSVLTIVSASGQVTGTYTLYNTFQTFKLSLRPSLYFLKFSNKNFSKTQRMVVW